MDQTAAGSKTAAPPSPSSWSWAPWAVLALALLVRLAYYTQVRGLLLFGEATGDAAQYVSIAAAIRREGFFAPAGQAYFQAPLYPWYLAFVQVLGGTLVTARILQFAGGALGALLAWDTARRIAGPLAGLVAGLFAALYAPRLFFEGELLSIAWALLFLQLSIWSIVRFMETGRSRWTVLSGIAGGLSSLAQPNTLLVVPAVFAWLYLWGRRAEEGIRRGLRPALVLFAAGVLVTILPVLVRNRVASGDWILISSNGGINFFIGNNADADGTFHMPAGEPLLNSTEGLGVSATEAASRALGRSAGPSETSAYWFRRGLAFWTASPLRALGLTARKTLYFLNGTELPNHYDIAFFRESVPVLRILPGFLLLAPLALWGLLALGRSSSRRLLAVVSLAYAASVILFFVTDRYRLPVIAAFFPAAGAGAADLVLVFRRGRPREIGPAAVTLVLFLVLAGFRFVDTKPGLAHMHNLLGTLHYNRNNLGAARAEFERSLAIDPGSPEAMNNLGRTELLSNRNSEAESWFRKALAADPRLPEAYFNLEELERNRGDLAEALNTLSDLERQVPGASTWAPAIAYRRGLLHAARGDTLDARRELEMAVRLKPDLAGAWAALGTMDLTAGELPAARERLTRAVRLAPEAYANQFNLGLVAERQRDYSAALASYREAGRLAPQKAQPVYRSALVLEALGRKSEALETYREARKIGGTGPEMKDIQERIAALEGKLP